LRDWSELARRALPEKDAIEAMFASTLVVDGRYPEAEFTTWLPLHLTAVHGQHKNFKIKSRKSLLLVLSHD
jgi:hypothetical protein